MLLSPDWGSQDQCLCQHACKHLQSVHQTGSAQHGCGTPRNKEEEVYSFQKKMFFFYYLYDYYLHSKCTQFVHLLLSGTFKPTGVVQSCKRNNLEVKFWSLCFIRSLCPPCRWQRTLYVCLLLFHRLFLFSSPFSAVFQSKQLGHVIMTWNVFSLNE